MTSFVSDDPEANFNLSIRLMCTLSFVVLAAWLWYFGTDVKAIRMAEPKERFRFCRQLTINLCLMSAVLGIVQISELDDIDYGLGKIDFGKYIEWVFTCPLTQLQLMVFAGPDCTSVGVWTPCRLTFSCLLAGAVASYFVNMPLKTGFFVLSSVFYVHLLYTLNIVVKEMSGGRDKLFWARKPASRLFTLVAVSWSVFPILWILSPEGFNLSASISTFKIDIVTAIANAAVKLTFMAVFQWVRVATLKEQTVEHEIRISQAGSDVESTLERIDRRQQRRPSLQSLVSNKSIQSVGTTHTAMSSLGTLDSPVSGFSHGAFAQSLPPRFQAPPAPPAPPAPADLEAGQQFANEPEEMATSSAAVALRQRSKDPHHQAEEGGAQVKAAVLGRSTSDGLDVQSDISHQKV